MLPPIRVERDTLLGARGRLHAALTRYGKPARTFSLIHADLHPRDVLIDPAQAAVIGFDDAGFAWQQYDLAVALIVAVRPPDRPVLVGFF